MDAFYTALTVLFGLVCGAASIAIYGRLSPQARLQELKSQCTALQQELAGFEGDFSGAWALARENMRVSFVRLGTVLWPSLLASLPVLLALIVVRDRYLSFLIATAISALVTKHVLRLA